MTLTRADAEVVLVQRAKGKMALVDMAITTVGTNADLNDPLSTAFRLLGYTPASPVTISDTDLTNLADSKVTEFLDRAELRLLETIHGNIDLVDITVGPRRESLNQLADQVKDAIDALQKKISTRYGDIDSATYPAVGMVRRSYRDAYRVTDDGSGVA